MHIHKWKQSLHMKNSTNRSLLAETDSSLVRAELERLLSDRRFSGARQMSAFLRYIVSETLDGNGNRIKAYTVGVDALGKADDFDAQSDPSVRVLALRLRKSLEAAYVGEPECHARIVMTVGSYVPEFYKPHTFVSDGDVKELQEQRGAAVAGNARVMSDDSAIASLRNDLPDESHSASKRLTGCGEIVSQSRPVEDFHRQGRRYGSGAANVARMTVVPDSTAKVLRDRFSVIMAVGLLAAVWQVSVNSASAATVSIDLIAPQVTAVSFRQGEPCAGKPLKMSMDTPVVALSKRS